MLDLKADEWGCGAWVGVDFQAAHRTRGAPHPAGAPSLLFMIFFLKAPRGSHERAHHGHSDHSGHTGCPALAASTVAPLIRNLLGRQIRACWRSGYLNGTREFSRPLVATCQIQTGPQTHERDDHFAAGDRPADDRFGILALTLWTGHITPPVLDRTNDEARPVCSCGCHVSG